MRRALALHARVALALVLWYCSAPTAGATGFAAAKVQQGERATSEQNSSLPPPQPSARIEPRRRQWVRHVSQAYKERQTLIIAMWAAIAVIALGLYWVYLRDAMPLLAAVPLCLLTLAIGLLYDDQHRNLVNEMLAFVCGIVTCLLLRLVTQRRVLCTCECRMCDGELLVGRKLGAGNFGSVFKCKTSRRSTLFQPGLHCVVKRIYVNLETDINDASEALQEAKSLLQLSAHPHIVSYMDVWLHRHNPADITCLPTTEVCLLMEFCRGGDLAQRLQNLRSGSKVACDGVDTQCASSPPAAQVQLTEEKTEQRLLSWFAQLCEAVSFIHSKGITHCDLKLENIFLTDPDDTLKIGDFGLSLQLRRRKFGVCGTDPAALKDSSKPSVTFASANVGNRADHAGSQMWGSAHMGSRGTPQFMAPECWDDNCTYTPKVDVWSVGAIWFVMLTGSSLLSHLETEDEEYFLGTLPVTAKSKAPAAASGISGLATVGGETEDGRSDAESGGSDDSECEEWEEEDYEYEAELETALQKVEQNSYKDAIRQMLHPDPEHRPSIRQVMTQLKLRTHLSKNQGTSQSQAGTRPPKGKGGGAQRRRRTTTTATPTAVSQQGRSPQSSPKIVDGLTSATANSLASVPKLYANETRRALGHRVLHGMASAAASAANVLSEFEVSARSAAACATIGAKGEALSSASTCPSGTGSGLQVAAQVETCKPKAEDGRGGRAGRRWRQGKKGEG